MAPRHKIIDNVHLASSFCGLKIPNSHKKDYHDFHCVTTLLTMQGIIHRASLSRMTTLTDILRTSADVGIVLHHR